MAQLWPTVRGMTEEITPRPRIYDPRPDDPVPDHPWLPSGEKLAGLCVAARSSEQADQICNRPLSAHARYRVACAVCGAPDGQRHDLAQHLAAGTLDTRSGGSR